MFIFTSLIAGLARTGDVERAFVLFGEMREAGISPTIVTYNALIDCCIKAGRLQAALDLLAQILKQVITSLTSNSANLAH